MAALNGGNFQVSGRGVRGRGWVEAAINWMTGPLFVLLNKFTNLSSSAHTKTHA